MISAKTLCPNKVTFTRFWVDMNLAGVGCREILFLPIQISLNNFCRSDNLEESECDRHWRTALYFRKMALVATEILIL